MSHTHTPSTDPNELNGYFRHMLAILNRLEERVDGGALYLKPNPDSIQKNVLLFHSDLGGVRRTVRVTIESVKPNTETKFDLAPWEHTLEEEREVEEGHKVAAEATVRLIGERFQVPQSGQVN